MTNFLTNVNSLIDPADEMYLHAVNCLKNAGLAMAGYFRQGAEINDTIQQLLSWRFGSNKNDVRFLDFACGYGRSTRFLVTQIPPDNVWVSDIYTDAVAFQRRTFGVHGFDSCTDPAALKCDERFDMIFVSSLFTHLPAARFEAWLRRLYEMLTPAGILAFSVHDEALAGSQRIPGSGVLFVEASESRTLSKNEYGSTYVTEEFVRSMIEAVAGPEWPYKRLVRALCGAHDVYVVSRDPQESFTGLHYTHPPVGYVELFRISEAGELRIGGWAGEPNEGVDLEAIQVKIDGRLIMSRKPDLARDDVVKALGKEKYARSGWECVHPIGDIDHSAEALIEVTAVSANGLSTMLHLSPLSAGREESRRTWRSVLAGLLGRR